MDTFFSIFLDRIDGIYRILIFSPAAIRPSAEGRFILTILLILSKDFEYGIESIHILFFRQDLQDLLDLFFACGDILLGRRPFYPDDPVDPV